MRDILLKNIAFLMALVLALSCFVLLPVSAQGEEKYFIFECLEDANGGEYLPVDAQLALPLSAPAVFTAPDFDLLSEESNAFYLSFTNNSSATKIRVSYTYKVQGGSATQVLEESILPNTEKQSLTLQAAHLDGQIEDLCITVPSDGEISGSLVLHAFFDISTYAKNDDNEVTLTRCHYVQSGNELQFEGSLSYAATVRYEGETLALFSLDEDDDLHLSGKTPLFQ